MISKSPVSVCETTKIASSSDDKQFSILNHDFLNKKSVLSFSLPKFFLPEQIEGKKEEEEQSPYNNRINNKVKVKTSTTANLLCILDTLPDPPFSIPRLSCQELVPVFDSISTTTSIAEKNDCAQIPSNTGFVKTTYSNVKDSSPHLLKQRTKHVTSKTKIEESIRNHLYLAEEAVQPKVRKVAILYQRKQSSHQSLLTQDNHSAPFDYPTSGDSWSTQRSFDFPRPINPISKFLENLKLSPSSSSTHQVITPFMKDNDLNVLKEELEDTQPINYMVQDAFEKQHSNSLFFKPSKFVADTDFTVAPGVETDFQSLIAPSLTGTRDNNIMLPPSIMSQNNEMNGLTDNDNGMSDNNDILNQRQDYFNRVLAEKESQIKALEEVKLKMEVQLSQEQNASRVLREYEKAMAQYAQQIDDLRQKLERSDDSKQTLIQERDQALEDLRNVESAFSDVHRKYERTKTVLENFRKNEDVLKQRDYEMQIKIDNRDKKIDMLKQKCQETLEQMHQDYEHRLKSMEQETHKLRALLRKTEMKIDSLENDLEQKGKENSQLSVLCDELISGKVSGS